MKLPIGVLIAYLALLVVGVIGYVMNVVSFVNSLGGELNAMFVARIVGIFAAPLGAILGYL